MSFVSKASISDYAELHCISNFTFLRGASHPEELVQRAAELGYRALAITDECSVAGVVRAYVAARELDLKLIIGSEFCLHDGLRLVLLVQNQRAYAQLCRLITRGRRAAAKGQYRLHRQDLERGLADCLALWLPSDCPTENDARWFARYFPGRAWVVVELLASGQDAARLAQLKALSCYIGLPCVAAGDVHMHCSGRRALQDTLTAIRIGRPIDQAIDHLFSNGERHLRAKVALKTVYPSSLLHESVAIAARCDFSLDELRYEYPDELVPVGISPSEYLRELVQVGIVQRWPEGASTSVLDLIEHELALIAELAYEAYFLTVYDVVRFARSRGILCQGRGSAANSVVCYCLGITEVGPERMSMLMERFISKERDEPPDIDVDFEHERREEVIQYLYEKYGRDRAAMTATVISYCPRSAIRDVGKALGMAVRQVDRMARAMQWWDGNQLQAERIIEAGLDPKSPVVNRLLVLVAELISFPRHLSQHVGGLLISKASLAELVPVENAAMPGRTVIQWDKNDLNALKLLKIDVLALGMLTAIRKSLDLIKSFYGRQLRIQDIPAEDPRVYDMICRADTIGVFQIESRAQMAMLPRLKPRCFYDLVIEVAIVRPGPIQGEMVHPYLRRRNAEEPISYPSEEVRSVLSRTLGVPIFQEQVMQLAIVAAGFTPGEADSLRQAMAAWHRRGSLGPFQERLITGMRNRGYREEFAQQIYQQICGFGEYGFPESHSASFALLAYISAWLKCYEPAVFTCALLNSQPMGFYGSSQLLQCVRRHGVEVRPVDVRYSDWDCGLERDAQGQAVLRLGLRMVKGLSIKGAQSLLAQRGTAPLLSVEDLAVKAKLNRGDLSALAAADALRGISGNRHQAHWQVAGVEASLPLLDPVSSSSSGTLPLLARPQQGEEIVADYNSMGHSLRQHPLALLRKQLHAQRLLSAAEVQAAPADSLIYAAGLVVTRQRPASAAGVIFLTLEDETGYLNLVVWERVAKRYRPILLGAALMAVWGRIQRESDVLHVVAQRLEDHSPLLGGLRTRSRNFH